MEAKPEEDLKNFIPESIVTAEIPQQPFDDETEVYGGSQTGENPEEEEFPQEGVEEEEVHNQLSPRGDVFSKQPFGLAPGK